MSSRYISRDRHPPKDSDLNGIKDHILDALSENILRVEAHYVGHHTTSGSVYVGVEGIVVMGEHLSSSGQDLSSLISQDVLEKLLSQAVSAQNKPPSHICSGGCASFLETEVGLATLLLGSEIRKSGRSRSSPSVDPCIEIIQDATRTALEDEGGVPDDGCEVLYGRAGLLYSLLRIRRDIRHASNIQMVEAISEAVSNAVIQNVVDEIVRRGKEGAADYNGQFRGAGDTPPLMWSWHGKRYLGGAHGVAGVLQILLSCPLELIKPHEPLILRTIEWLVSIQDANGNWSHKASTTGNHSNTEMVQWCHGAPAVIILLSTLVKQQGLYRALSLESQAAVATALEKGSFLVYEQGFLRKGVGLCHGIGGNVFSLLAASHAFSVLSVSVDSVEADLASLSLRRAVRLADMATEWKKLTKEGEMTEPDRPLSLYEGLAGMCAAWASTAERIQGRTSTGMPGYDDLD